MKRSLLSWCGLILLFLLPIALPAQAPGYLGKRFSIDLGTGFGPAIDGPTQNNKGYGNILGNKADDRRLGINYVFDLNLNFATGRYRGLSLTASQYYTATTTFYRIQSQFDNFLSDEVESLHRLNVRHVGLKYHYFKRSKGALAPIGNSFYVAVDAYFINGEVIDRIINYANPLSAAFGIAPLGINQNLKTWGVGFGWQKTTIYFDKLLLRVGIGIHGPVGFYIRDLIDEANVNIAPDNGRQSTYENKVANRLYLHGLMRFELGLGYLIF